MLSDSFSHSNILSLFQCKSSHDDALSNIQATACAAIGVLEKRSHVCVCKFLKPELIPEGYELSKVMEGSN